MIRFLLLGMAVKLAHFARNVKIVTRTPGVSLTGVLAINNGPHCKLFEGVTIESFTRYWSLWSFTWPTNSLTSMHLGYKINCEKCQGHHTELELRPGSETWKNFRLSIKICYFNFRSSSSYEFSLSQHAQWQLFHSGALRSGTRLSGRGGGVHPLMVYSGQVPPERDTFSRIHSVYERVEILLVELYFSSLKRLKKANRLI